MTRHELNLWGFYRSKFGLDTDRIEWSIANAGSAICHALGARVKAEDILPEFAEPLPLSTTGTIYRLASLPGAHVVFTPNDPTKPSLVGEAALEELDKADARARVKKAKSALTLDQKQKPEKQKKRRTLSGD